MLPPSAEASVPKDLDDAQLAKWVAEHPERQEVRMTVAVLRDGARESALRLREKDAPTEVLTGSGPGAGAGGGAGGDVRHRLTSGITRTRDSTTRGGRRAPGPAAAPRASCVPLYVPLSPSAHRGRPAVSARADLLEGLQRVVDGVDLHQGEPVRDVLGGRRAVVLGRQEVLRAPASRAPIVFISMPPIGPDLALVVDGAGARDELAAGQVARRSACRRCRGRTSGPRSARRRRRA